VCCSEVQVYFASSVRAFMSAMLQCVAVCCGELQCVAVRDAGVSRRSRCTNSCLPCCSVLQCVAVSYSVLQCVAVRCRDVSP